MPNAMSLLPWCLSFHSRSLNSLVTLELKAEDKLPRSEVELEVIQKQSHQTRVRANSCISFVLEEKQLDPCKGCCSFAVFDVSNLKFCDLLRTSLSSSLTLDSVFYKELAPTVKALALNLAVGQRLSSGFSIRAEVEVVTIDYVGSIDLQAYPGISGYSCKDNYTDGEIDPCSICLEDSSVRTELIPMQCSHSYHPRCIIRWLVRNKKTCPICRRQLLQKD